MNRIVGNQNNFLKKIAKDVIYAIENTSSSYTDQRLVCSWKTCVLSTCQYDAGNGGSHFIKAQPGKAGPPAKRGKADGPEPGNICHQVTKTRRILFWILCWYLGAFVAKRKKFGYKKHNIQICRYLSFYNRKNIGQNQGRFHKILISIAKKYHNNLDITLVHDIEI